MQPQNGPYFYIFSPAQCLVFCPLSLTRIRARPCSSPHSNVHRRDANSSLMTDASASRSGAFPSQAHQLPALTSGIVSERECSLDANSNAIDIHPLPPRPLALQHGRTSSTQSQDKAIYDFWKRGTNPEHILEYVATYREIERTSNQHDLAIMARIPAGRLAERIFNVGQ